MPPGAEACPVCGLSLTKPAAPAAGPSRTPCVACGEFILAGSEVCPSCGAGQKAPPRRRPRRTAKRSSGQALEGSSTYLVIEDQPDQTYKMLRDEVRRGRRGLCATRVYPPKLKTRFANAEVSTLWLSNVGKEDAIRPKDLEKLSLAVEQFVSREPAVVLLDGLEYLVTNNNFLTVLRLVQAIRDQVAIHKGILLLSLSPSALEAQQLTLLEREVDEIIGSASTPAA